MIKLEYIWIDGTKPTNKLRSKTKIITEFDGTINGPSGCPIWSFDGSSTNQASGDKSDCVLQPVRLYENPLDGYNSYIVICEVLNTDETPHKINGRFKLREIINGNQDEPWVGIEQEYTLFKDGRPLGWPTDSEPESQGDYYCGRNIGEDIARKHMDACIKCNIKISGINSEVMLGQWEYQIGADDPLRISDDLWVARWLLEKICSEDGITVSLDPKPVKGDWNGAGAHTNFSTKAMREDDGVNEIFDAIERLAQNHKEHIKVYGDGNERRLTGEHETCDINTFRWGISDRGASVRVPWQVSVDGKGYLEDRRPSANMDPYLVCNKLIETICGRN